MAHSPTHQQPSVLPRWLPLALLGAALVALFHRLFLGEVLFWGLPALQFEPWRAFASAEIAAGRLPLWNPYNGGGAPLLANYQSAILYPPHLIYLFTGRAPVVGLFGVAHVLWTGLGMWLYTGRLGLPLLGRGIATLAFPLSTTLIARLGTPPMIDVAAWLPWLLLGLDGLRERPGALRIVGLAAIVAMMLLAGHAQWAIYCLALGGAYVLWRLGMSRQPFWRLGPVLAALALGLALAAAQLVPTLELQRLSQRAGGVAEAFALNFSLPVPSLVTLLNPDFYGNPGDGTYAIGGAYFETTAYAGVFTALLALLTLGGRVNALRSRRLAAYPHAGLIGFFALTGGLSLLLAFGSYTPVFPFLYRHIPGFNLFQAPARFLLVTVFALVMLAALGTPALLGATRTPSARRWRRLSMAAALGLALTGVIGSALVRDQSVLLGQLAQGLATLGVLLFAGLWLLGIRPRPGDPRVRRWSAVVLLVLAADLVWANGRSNPTTDGSFFDPLPVAQRAARSYFPEGEFQRLVYEVFLPFSDYRLSPERVFQFRRSGLPNMNLLDRQASLNNFDPLRPAWFERFMDLLDTSTRRDALATAAATGSGDSALRAWLATEALAVPDAESASAAIAAPDFDPGLTVVIETTAALPAPESSNGTVHIVAEDPQMLLIDVDSTDGGFLVLADTYYPGWEALLDGALVPIYRANLSFRAVQVPAGVHRVEMHYRPASLMVGLALSGLALVLAAALTALACLRYVVTRQK